MKALIGALLLSSCAAGSAATSGANLALGVALGVTAAGVNRASGGCYASCPPGTSCNSASGMCDELPCRGRCGADEVCDMNRPVPTCVAAREPDLQIGRGKEEPARVTPQ